MCYEKVKTNKGKVINDVLVYYLFKNKLPLENYKKYVVIYITT